MENLILENSFASIKQVSLSPEDSRNKLYLVIQGDEQHLQYKIVPEKNVNELKNIRFKKLYCISAVEDFQLENLVTVQNHENFHEITLQKSLNHPSVNILKKLPTEKVERVPEKIVATNPFDSIKKPKKTNLTKESFFATFKKFEKIGNSTDNSSFQKDDEPVNVSLKGDRGNGLKVESEKTKKNEEQVAKKQKKNYVKKHVEVEVSEESMNQEAALKDMFQNENVTSEEKEEIKEDDQSQEFNESKKIRKKRKVLKTMTFMEGKYMKTRDVETWESYSESEHEVKKADGFNDLHKKRKAQGQQQHSISSFFTRK